MNAERTRLILLLAIAVISVALFATVAPKGRAPDEFRYYSEIATLAKTGHVVSNTGHPPLYSFVGQLPYRLVRNDVARSYLIRLLGTIFMAVVVFVTYLTSADLFPENTLARWAPPLIVALIPQFAFVSGSVNSDGLLAMLTALFIYLCVRLMRRPATAASVAGIVAVCVLGVATKQRFLVVLPLLAPVLAAMAARRFPSSQSPAFRKAARWAWPAAGATLVAGALALIPLGTGGLDRAMSLLSDGQVAKVITADFFVDLFATFWGYFDWLALPMHAAVYWVFAAICAVSAIGVVAAAVRRVRRLGLKGALEGERAHVWVLLGAGLLFALLSVIEYRVAGLAAQGRYLFIVAVPFAVFLGRGVAEVVPARFARMAFQALALVLVGVLFVQFAFLLVPYYY